LAIHTEILPFFVIFCCHIPLLLFDNNLIQCLIRRAIKEIYGNGLVLSGAGITKKEHVQVILNLLLGGLRLDYGDWMRIC
jgi:hypothetical protein